MIKKISLKPIIYKKIFDFKQTYGYDTKHKEGFFCDQTDLIGKLCVGKTIDLIDKFCDLQTFQSYDFLTIFSKKPFFLNGIA